MSLVFRHIRKFLVLPALVVCAQASWAAAGDTTPARVDAKALGTNDSILRYCGKASPSSVPALQKKHLEIAQGASDAELDKVRQSTPYLEAFSAEENFLHLIDERNVKRVCPTDPAAKQKAQ